jgi:hypothetical protein
MGAAVRPLAGWALAAPGFAALAARTLAAVAAGVGLYFGLAVLTRRPQAETLGRFIRRRPAA